MVFTGYYKAQMSLNGRILTVITFQFFKYSCFFPPYIIIGILSRTMYVHNSDPCVHGIMRKIINQYKLFIFFAILPANNLSVELFFRQETTAYLPLLIISSLLLTYGRLGDMYGQYHLVISGKPTSPTEQNNKWVAIFE